MPDNHDRSPASPESGAPQSGSKPDDTPIPLFSGAPLQAVPDTTNKTSGNSGSSNAAPATPLPSSNVSASTPAPDPASPGEPESNLTPPAAPEDLPAPSSPPVDLPNDMPPDITPDALPAKPGKTTTSPKRRRGCLKLGGLVLILLVLAGVGLRFLYFNDAYLRHLLIAHLDRELGVQTSIEKLELSLFSNRLVLHGLSMENTEAPAPHARFLEIERLEAGCSPWGVVASGFRHLAGVQVDVHAPAIHIARLQDPGRIPVTNVDPVVLRLMEFPWMEWAMLLNIPDLRGVTRIHDGRVTFVDDERELGQSQIRDFNLTLHHEGLDDPGRIELTLHLATPDTPEGGRVESRGSWIWGGEHAQDVSLMVRDVQTEVAFDNLDLPYLFRYLGIGGPLAGGEFHWSLGRPLRGALSLHALDLSAIETEGYIETPGVFSLWQQDMWRAGRIAGRVDWKGSGGIDAEGLRLEPTRIDLALAHTLEELALTDARRALDVGLTFSGSQTEGFRFSVNSRSYLERLFSTDVGSFLHLQDQMGGLLHLLAEATLTPDGGWTAEATLRSEETYILVENVRQPTESSMHARISLRPDARGWPERGEITLDCQAGFMTLRSVDTIRLEGLNSLATVHGSGHVEFRMDLAQMWKEYGPLLTLFGLPHPLSEHVGGRVRFEGKPGSLTILPHIQIRQDNDATPPLQLDGRMLYHGEALAMNPENPFLDITLRLLQQGNDPEHPLLQILLYGTAQKTEARSLTWILRKQASGRLDALWALRERAGAYASDFVPDGITMQGGFSTGSSIRLIQTFDSDGRPASMTAQASTRLDLSEFDLHAPPLLEDSPPFRWREPSLQSRVRLSLEWTPARLLATLQEADIRSSLLTARVHAGRTEPLLLSNHLQSSPVSFPQIVATLPRFLVHAQLHTVPGNAFTPPDFTAFLPPDLRPLVPAGGTFRIQAEYDPATRRMKLDELQFHASTLFTALRGMTLPLDRLAHALATGDLPPFLQQLSDFQIEGWITPQVLQVLFDKDFIPSSPFWMGTGSLKASYDASNKNMRIEELSFRESPHSHSLIRLAVLQGDVHNPFALLELTDPMQLPRHLGQQGMTIQALDFNPVALAEYSAELGFLLADHGITLGQFAIRDLACLPDERPGWFRIAGTLFSVLRIVDTEEPHETLLDLRGPITLSPGAPMYLALDKNQIGLSGTLLLDRAAIEFRGAYPYLYNKPADTLARLSLRMSATDPRHMHIQNLVLHGGQQPLEAQDFLLSIDPDSLAISLHSLLVKEPLGISLRDVLLNTGEDRLAFSMEAPHINLASLHPHLDTAKPFSMEGELTGLVLSFDGPFSLFRRLTSGTPPTGGTSRIAGKSSHIHLRATEPGMTHTFAMRLSSVDGALETGTFIAHDLVIGAPHGFNRADPVKIKTARLVLDLNSLATDTLVIRELTLDGVDATLEMGFGNNNLTHIQNAITYFQTCMDPGTGEGKKMLIRDFYMKNSVVRASPRPLMGISIIPPTPLPDLHLTNITGDGGGAVFTQVAGAMVGSVLKVGLNVVKGIGTGAGRVVEGAGGAVRGVGSGIGGGLRRIVGGGNEGNTEEQAPVQEDTSSPDSALP